MVGLLDFRSHLIFVPFANQPLLNFSGDFNSKLVRVFKWSKTVYSLNGPLFKPCFEK